MYKINVRSYHKIKFKCLIPPQVLIKRSRKKLRTGGCLCYRKSILLLRGYWELTMPKNCKLLLNVLVKVDWK